MDRELLSSLIEQGLSTRELSLTFNKSQGSIRHWLKKYNLKTKNKSFKEGYINPNIKRVEIGKQKCCGCDVLLTIENSYDRKQRKTYVSYCRNCVIKNNKERRIKFKQSCINYKGESCVKCGYNKNITALEFHHKNPKNKEIEPSKMMNKSPEFIKNELDKCDLLCSNCHREEHYKINQKKKQEKQFNINFFSSFSDCILTGKNTNMKSCKQCDIVLTKDNTGPGTHNTICKPCDSKNVIEKSIQGKQRCVDYMGGCCSVCEYNDCITALEFHHIDPSKKSQTYERRFRSWGFERQKKELENCSIVCSNCHREIHSKDEWNT